MLANVSVIIPFKSDHGPREAAFQWVLRFYENTMPEVEVCVGKSDTDPFNKSQAVNIAVQQSTRDILVIADADIFCDPMLIVESVRQLDNYAWIIPYRNIIKLSHDDTQTVLQSEAKWPLNVALSRSEFLDASSFVGALNVVPRKYFNRVRGFDERFAGWGREDDAFSFALDTLCGTHKRIETTIYHFWHPFVGTTGNPNIHANTELWWAYRNAYGNPNAMSEVIALKPLN
jgi:predicted glycosyltransferase involved in capsule biosynthesis